MEITKYILKLTNTEAAVKVSGNAGSVVFDLANDLTNDGYVLNPNKVPYVTILGIQWTGDPSFYATITRGEHLIHSMYSNSGSFFGQGQDIAPDNVNATAPIQVNIVAGSGQVYLRLRKVEGWLSNREPEIYGVYDNINKPGE